MIIATNKINLSKKDKFYYCDFGSERHGRTSFRLWVHNKLVTDNEGTPILQLPCEAKLVKGKKDWVLRPDENHLTFDLYLPCGYRGGASFTILKSSDEVAVQEARYYIYKSPLGNLGVSEGAIVSIPKIILPVNIEWSRSGRTYGDPKSGVAVLHEDGTITEQIPEDVAELLE